MTSCDGGVTYAAGGLPKLVFLHAGCTLKGIRTCVQVNWCPNAALYLVSSVLIVLCCHWSRNGDRVYD